jgi:IS30 family transposase
VAWSGSRIGYRAWRADEQAMKRARRPKPAKLAINARLRHEVERGLRARWSPQQIAARLASDYPDDLEMRVSHETIYRTLFVQARGALRKELTTCLRTGRTQRRPQMRTGQSGAGRLQNMILISERPPEIEDRAVPGHWEGDLIIGKGGRSAIGVLVERASRYVMLFRLPHGRTAEHVREVLTRQVSKLPAELRRTLTWDQGKEMAEHVRFTTDTNMTVYFCDPHSPWQRGSNENTNGLLRQYFPSKADLSLHSAAHLNAVARQLNNRPRQTLNWMKPSEVFCRTVASID